MPDNVAEPGPGVAGWKNANAGALLRTSVYRIIGGTQQVSVNGGTFTATGATTFSTMSGTSRSEVYVLGGGAGGGGCEGNTAGARSSAGGGGSGGEAVSILTGSLSNISITVGVGGSGGASAGIGVGGNGGTSSFGELLSASGGCGGSKGLTTAEFPIFFPTAAPAALVTKEMSG